MKYELNTPYDFEVRNVIQDNDSLAFEVEVAGNLFPVKAYLEQIEEVVPKTLSCRIMLDKNKNAYLIQNEAFLYPFLYKPEKRYIFEVADIRDGYVVLKDKHGLFHAMELDGTKLSVNEIIVRCVNVIVDNGFKAHLSFYYSEPVLETQHKDIEQVASKEPSVEPRYVPTIFEEDTPGDDIVQQVNTLDSETHCSIETSNTQNNESEKCDDISSVSYLLENKDWDRLEKCFDVHLGKKNTPVVLKEVADAFRSITTAAQYWDAVNFLICYDAHTFLCTIANVDTSNIVGIQNEVDSFSLDQIIEKSFSVTDKLKYALSLLIPCSNYLTRNQKNYIQSKCVLLNTPDAFYSMFKLLHLMPDDAISYLLSLKENIAAAFTVFKFYCDGKKGNLLSENSNIRSFKPSMIQENILAMTRMHSLPFTVSANLIKAVVFSVDGCCPTELQRDVMKDGYDGFYKYVVRKQQQKKTYEVKQLVEAITIGSIIKDLQFENQTDNYYILRNKLTGIYAFLDKNLAKIVPSSVIMLEANVVKIMCQKGKKLFFVSQKSISSRYTLPSLYNKSSIVEIGFHDSGKGNYNAFVKKTCNLIDVELDFLPPQIDLRQKYQAQIIMSKDFFTYKVRIVDSTVSNSQQQGFFSNIWNKIFK